MRHTDIEGVEVADMPWLQAMQKVMQDDGKPMHYADIAQAIVDKGYRKHPGATPANTVATNLHLSMKKGTLSPFVKVEPGVYALKNIQPAPIDEIVEEAAETGDTPPDANPIKAFGMFWSRDRVHWTQKMPSLLGEQVSGSKGVNFTQQAGVYLLYDASRVIYVGKAVDQGLGVRLYQHTRDRLSGRWNRFSWFGMRGVNDDGSLAEVQEDGFGVLNVITVMEALLIEGLEPPQNRRQGDGFAGLEFIQKDDPQIVRELQKAVIAKMQKSIETS